jgi:CheY-like chemotaxis protein
MLEIVLIEDNPADVLLVQEALHRLRTETQLLVAHDGEQALQMLDELRSGPDFIFLDLNIPKLDGLTLLQRCLDRLGAPVIVLTGSENPADKEKALKLGAREYLVKPCEFDAFVETIQGMIDRWVRAE